MKSRRRGGLSAGERKQFAFVGASGESPRHLKRDKVAGRWTATSRVSVGPLFPFLARRRFARRFDGNRVARTRPGAEPEKLCDHICLISRGQAILKGELAAIKRELGGNSFRH